VLSKRQPTDSELKDAHLAWIGAKAIQSNSFAFVKMPFYWRNAAGKPTGKIPLNLPGNARPNLKSL